MSGHRRRAFLEADALVSRAERLTEMRLLVAKDIDLSHEIREQRIKEINQELRRIETRLAELEIGD